MANKIKFYELVEREYERVPGMIMTAAFRYCGACGEAIDSMGGPGSGSICLRCGDALKSGRARGYIVHK